jgi:hypothetical protein
MVPGDIENELGDEAPAHVLEDADTHVAAAHALERVHLRDGGTELLVHAPDLRQHHLARGGEPHAARQALEQRHPELLFEARDLPGDGGRRDVQPFGRPADRFLCSDLFEIADGM